MAAVTLGGWVVAQEVTMGRRFQINCPDTTEMSSRPTVKAASSCGPGRNACLVRVSHDGQAQAWAYLAFTDPGRPVIATTGIQEPRETITSQHSDGSRKEAQVHRL